MPIGVSARMAGWSGFEPRAYAGRDKSADTQKAGLSQF